jgi:hypothetical protein
MFVDGRVIRGRFTVETRYMRPPIEDLFQVLRELGKSAKKPHEVVAGLARELVIGGLEKLLDHMNHDGGSTAGYPQSFIDVARDYILNYQQSPN